MTIFIVGTNLTKPFWGEHDWNGARYGNIARNYLRYGYVLSKFGQVENGGISKPSSFIYYTHYQPLLSVLISVSYRFLGVSEFATRAVPVLATAGFIVVIYFIGRELISWQMGIFSSLLALATPMIRYYGKNPVHEPLALFFSSLAFLGLLKRNKFLVLIGIILTALINWSFIFLVMGISVFLLSKRNIKMIIGLWILVIILMALHFLQVYILTGSFFGGNLLEAFLERTSVGQVGVKFTLIQYLLQVRLWASTLFTNSLLLSAAIGIGILFRSKLSEFKKFTFSILIYCLYPIFFANASFIHSYFIYYLVLPLSLLGGFLLNRLFKSKRVLLLLCFIIIASVWFERSPYVAALNSSQGDKMAVEIATTIQSVTGVTDTILIRPNDYAMSRLPILSYYSDRNIVITTKPNWIVNVDGDRFTITKQK